LWKTEFDEANFQRAMRGSSRGAQDAHRYIEATGDHAAPSRRGGRPPELYRSGPAWAGTPPIRRPRAC
jgi:hypothetical protein